MYNLLVTGASGQVGSEIKELALLYPSYNFIFSDSKLLDITNHDAINEFVISKNINIIINCAAYTAVDKAETDIAKADKINNLAVENIAVIAKKNNIKLVHISTDYVFDGKEYQPYKEDHITNPQNIYGTTKLAGEKAIQRINPSNSIIIRTSWVYSTFGSNFVKTMLRLQKDRNELAIIMDQVGTPTYAGDLAKTILDILPKIKNNVVEIYHYSNEGVCSWYDFAKTIFSLEKLSLTLKPIETKDFPTPAIRPYYTVMNKAKIKNTFQIEVPYWKDSIEKCLKKMRSQKCSVT